MDKFLSSSLKAEFQQRYRGFQECFNQHEEARRALLKAKSSRIWILGALALLFSFESEFFLGMAGAFLGTYCYQAVSAYIKKAQIEDCLDDMSRWFQGKGLSLHDTTVFFTEDTQLENPIDLYADAVYQ